MSVADAALDLVSAIVVGAAAFYSVSALIARHVRRRSMDDPALVIKPPRRFVDADGRSDFRQEKLAALVRRHGER